jgi:LemA protein
MSLTEMLWAAVVAALVFWGVGAYNRLVRLRAAIVRCFGPAHERFNERNALLQRLVTELAPALPNAGPRLESLSAACQQVHAACATAKARPGAVGAITSLRLADHILGEARAHLPVQSVAGVDIAALNAQLGNSDAALAFARQQFNDAVGEYNRAIKQFPTLLLVGMFGFRSAATL